MALFRAIGALAFVIGVTLLALDAARSLKISRFETTSVERLWTNLGGDRVFQLRSNLSQWLGGAADQILDLPAALVAVGLGLALMLMTGSGRQDTSKPPLAL